VDVIFTFVGVPAWASSNPNDTTCAYWSGACDAPNDLNTDGTGTNKHWKDFVTAIAAHTGSSIKYWELWNEPNISGQANKNWTSAQWVRLGNDARSIILATNPSAQFLSPGVAITSNTNWLKSFLTAGGTNYADIVAYHGYAVPPEVEVSEITSIQAAMLVGGASSKPMWDTEGSWGPPSNVPALSLQVGYVARMYLLHAANGVARFYWYGWEFGGALWQPDTLIGCTAPSNGGYLCPSGLAYQQTYSWIVGAVLRGCSVTGTTWTCTLARPTGYLAQIVWDTSQTCNGSCTTTPYVPPQQYKKYRDLNGNTFTVSGSSVPIGAQPIILENQ
jgi:hypothetical protein